ncbi:MAG: hypothetical protein ACWA5U_03850 [bacterium]
MACLLFGHNKEFGEIAMMIKKMAWAMCLVVMMAGVVVADPFGVTENQKNHLNAAIAEVVNDADVH